MQLLTYVFALVGAFLILVTVHEYGHFIVARKLGVQVQRFSIGLGPIVWRYMSKGGTEFAISAIPIGGYIAMLDTRTQEVPPHLEHQAFDRVAPWRQIAIASAGPLANLLLAFVLFWLVMFNGVQVPVPYVGQVEDGSPAYVAGLRGGEEIVAVDGEPVEQWMDVIRATVRRVGDTGTIVLGVTTADAEQQTFRIPIHEWLRDASEPDVMGSLGISRGTPAVLNEVLLSSAADLAGLKPGDKVLAISGQTVRDWQDLVDIVRAAPSTEIEIQFERDGLNYTLPAVPHAEVAANGTLYGVLGVRPNVPTRELGQGVFGSMAYAANETWSFTALTVTSIKKMITGEMATSNLAGPITIAHMAGSVAQIGMDYYLRLIAMLSISLFLINLLPIPVLDGGHIVYGLIEMVTRRRVSLRIQRVASMCGIALLGCLILLVIYNDVVRLAGG